MDFRCAHPIDTVRPRFSWRRSMALWLAPVDITLQAFAPLVHAAVICGLRSVQSPNLQILCSIDGFSVVDWSRIENGDGAAGNPIGFHIPAHGAQGKFKDPYCCDSGPVMLSATEPSPVPTMAER